MNEKRLALDPRQNCRTLRQIPTSHPGSCHLSMIMRTVWIISCQADSRNIFVKGKRFRLVWDQRPLNFTLFFSLRFLFPVSLPCLLGPAQFLDNSYPANDHLKASPSVWWRSIVKLVSPLNVGSPNRNMNLCNLTSPVRWRITPRCGLLRLGEWLTFLIQPCSCW